MIQIIKKQRLSFFGEYLSSKQLFWRLVIYLILLAVYVVTTTLLFKRFMNSSIFSMNIIPIALAGVMFGVLMPVVVGTFLTIYIQLLLSFTPQFTGIMAPGALINMMAIVVGVGIGRLNFLSKQAKESEKALLAAKNEAEKANRTKSEFLAHMSHEIRTPMNSIIGFSSLLYDEIKDPNHKEQLNIIVNAGNILLTLINDLLDFSRIEADELELSVIDFSFTQLFAPVQNIFALKAREKCLDFDIRLNPGLPELVRGDERRIQQVIINLVANAIKFTEQGGVEVLCDYNDGKTIITVVDTGIGIPADKQELIFKPFKQVDPSMTRKYSGSGLGLAISLRIIEAMNGTITFRSRENEGTEFTVEIPLPEIHPETMSEKEKSQEPDSSQQDQLINVSTLISNLKDFNFRFNVLVVEDNAMNREFLKHLLNIIGVSYTFATDGKEAICMLEESLAPEQEGFDLVLLDIEIPVINGVQVLEFIRRDEDLKSLYVIALTAHAIKGDQQKYLEAGCNYYISKPVDKTLLTNKIYHLIMKKYNKMSSAQIIGANEETSSVPKERLSLDTVTSTRLLDAIHTLKKNSEIFVPAELEAVLEQLEDFLPSTHFPWIEQKIRSAINNFDDGLLLEVIKALESFLED